MESNTNNQLQDIKQTVMFKAPIERVWETVSTSDGIASWFMANDFEPEVGYEFHIQSPFGPSPCKVLEIEAPYKLSFSWDRMAGLFPSFLKRLIIKRNSRWSIAGGSKPMTSFLRQMKKAQLFAIE